MGHGHLNSRDGVAVYLHLRPGSPPAAGGTVGSVVNHVGFAVKNVPESVARWKAAGVPVEPGNNNRFVDIPGAQMRFAKTDAPSVTTKGRVLDHFGFDVTDIEAFTRRLAAAGVKLDRPVTRNEKTGRRRARLYLRPLGRLHRTERAQEPVVEKDLTSVDDDPAQPGSFTSFFP